MMMMYSTDLWITSKPQLRQTAACIDHYSWSPPTVTTYTRHVTTLS